MNTKTSYYSITTSAGVISVILTCFFIPISTSLMGICSVLALFFWIISGRVLQLPRMMSRIPVVFFSILLFLLFVVGLSYSPAPLPDALDTLLKYRELLFIPVVIGLLAENHDGARMAENSFIAGCILLLAISYGIYFSLIPPFKFGNSVLHHITHSFFMAVLSFWALQRTMDSHQYRYFWLLIFIAAAINLISINHGRTGMLVFILLMLLTLIQRMSLTRLLIGLLVLVSLVTATYFTSDNFSSRATVAIQEIQNYQPGKSRTSLGMRFDWWQNSIDLMEDAPILGHGTGSFAMMQKSIKEKKTMATDNPHNEYLFIGAQLGGLGLLTYILLLVSQITGVRRMIEQKKFLVQGIVVAMASGCLMNSFLFDSHQGHFYAFISAIFFAGNGVKNSMSL